MAKPALAFQVQDQTCPTTLLIKLTETGRLCEVQAVLREPHGVSGRGGDGNLRLSPAAAAVVFRFQPVVLCFQLLNLALEKTSQALEGSVKT